MSSSEEDSSSSEEDSSSSEGTSSSDYTSSSLDEEETNFHKAFLRRSKPLTGGWKNISYKVTKRIKGLTKHRKGKFWIGKTSGGRDGCKTRWGKYKSDGMNRMAMVYQSESEDFALNMEEAMIEIFKRFIWNETGGGGGNRADDNPHIIVYIAWKI